MNMDTKQKLNGEFDLAPIGNQQEDTSSSQVLVRDPITGVAAAGINGVLFSHLKENPDVWLRSCSFDGLGRKVETEELEETNVYFFDCEVLDYDCVDPKTQKLKHYHYSAWRGIKEIDGESIIYFAGTKLTKLADDLTLPENAHVLDALREKGAHFHFPRMKRLANGNSFCNPDLIP